MKQKNLILITTLLICSISLSACGNKGTHQSEVTTVNKTDRHQKMMEKIIESEGSDEDKAHFKCLKETRVKVTALKSKLSPAHKSALRETFENLSDSSDDCRKALAMLNKIETEIQSQEAKPQENAAAE